MFDHHLNAVSRISCMHLEEIVIPGPFVVVKKVPINLTIDLKPSTTKALRTYTVSYVRLKIKEIYLHTADTVLS